MKPLNDLELDAIMPVYQSLEGSVFQDFFYTPNALIFKFYRHKVLWLVFYIDHTPSPLLWLDSCPERVKKMIKGNLKKPISLFLRSHFLGGSLREVRRASSGDRRVFFLFENSGQRVQLEFHIIPHRLNCIATSGEKKVSLRRIQSMPSPQTLPDGLTIRSLSDLEAEIEVRGVQLMTSSRPKTDKTEKIKSKIASDLKKRVLEIQMFRVALSEWEKQGCYLRPDTKILNVLDGLQTLDDAYHRLKLLEQKKQRAEKRLEELNSSGEQCSPQKKKMPVVKKITGVQTFELADNLLLRIGKSAKSNRELLRSAKPHDYFLHIRDQPGCYGIIVRNRTRKLTQSELQIAGKIVLENSVKNYDSKSHYSLHFTECRFVRPLKGDRLGRVTIQKSENLRI